MPKEENYIQKIVDEIITNANLGGLPDSEKKAFRESMEAQINRRLGLIIIQELDKKGLKEYEKIAKKGLPNSAKMKKFLEKNVNGYKKKIEKGMAEFIEEVMIAMSK